MTFLFTDIEGSTVLLQHLGDQGYAEVLHAQQRLLRAAFEAHGGREVDTQGDAFLVAFGDAEAAVAATVAAQRAIRAHAWPQGVSVRVRIGLHTGEPLLAGTHYVGLDVHRSHPCLHNCRPPCRIDRFSFVTAMTDSGEEMRP